MSMMMDEYGRTPIVFILPLLFFEFIFEGDFIVV